MLERLARRIGYSLRKVSAGSYKHEKFDWLLTQTEGRFIVVTTTNEAGQARDGHTLTARNTHHWIAISADEKLVLDSLARTLGPQTLSQATLRRSVRDGVLRIYKIERARLCQEG